MEFKESIGNESPNSVTEISQECQENSEPDTTTPSHSSSIPVSTNSQLTVDQLRGIVGGELITLKQQMENLEELMNKLSVACKDSLDYCERYQKNTVSVLQNENKEKDRYISGMLLVDLLKPIAKICSKIEHRIGKAFQPADKKFLQDILDDIFETVIDDYGVEISITKKEDHRPENISKVEGVVPTGDSRLKNLVAESISPAWTIQGKLIQKECVNVYQYDPSLAQMSKEIPQTSAENQQSEETRKLENTGYIGDLSLNHENSTESIESAEKGSDREDAQMQADNGTSLDIEKEALMKGSFDVQAQSEDTLSKNDFESNSMDMDSTVANHKPDNQFD